MNEGLMMDVVLLTPRGRAMHAGALAILESQPFDSATFDPELYNNGVLIAATQRHNFRAMERGDFLQITGVICEIEKDSIVEPIVTSQDEFRTRVGAHIEGERSNLRALFPIELFRTDRKLTFHVDFESHERKTVTFSKRDIKNLR
jgi:hypothetical protein